MTVHELERILPSNYGETEFTVGNKTVKIEYDSVPMNPAEEWDCLGIMACWHSRYTLGHEQPSQDPEEFMLELGGYDENDAYDDRWIKSDILEEKAKKKAMEEFDKKYVSLLLYLYDHSGITISTRAFSCSWDSGQVGFIYAKKAEILKEWNRRKWSKKLEKKIISILESEVKEYNHYLTGNVFGYTITELAENGENGKGEEEINSCWGFYGDHKESGILEYIAEYL